MAMKISVNPVDVSRIKSAMDQLSLLRPELAAQIQAAMLSAHAQAVAGCQDRYCACCSGCASFRLACS